MGAINNAFNQAAGAVATAAYGIEKIKESQLAEGESAKNELVDVDKVVIPKLKEDVKDQTTKVENTQKDVAALGDILKAPGAIKSKEDLEAFDELQKGVTDDTSAAMKSLQTLKVQLSAKEDMRRRIEKAIKRANNWRGR